MSQEILESSQIRNIVRLWQERWRRCGNRGSIKSMEITMINGGKSESKRGEDILPFFLRVDNNRGL